MRRILVALSAGVLMLASAGCGLAPSETPRPVTLIPGPILTFRVMREQDGGPVRFCPTPEAVQPVRGVFEGNPARSSQIAWLRAPDGRELSVAWPEGFTVRFEPLAALYDEKGRAVARHGVGVDLPQVNVFDHAGTVTDPYIASGILFNGCYPLAR